MQKNKLFRLLGVTFVASVLSLSQGCAYRSDLAQGNFVEQDAVDKLSYGGMTGDQVRYILVRLCSLILLTIHAGTMYISYVKDGMILRFKKVFTL